MKHQRIVDSDGVSQNQPAGGQGSEIRRTAKQSEARVMRGADLRFGHRTQCFLASDSTAARSCRSFGIPRCSSSGTPREEAVARVRLRDFQQTCPASGLHRNRLSDP